MSTINALPFDAQATKDATNKKIDEFFEKVGPSLEKTVEGALDFTMIMAAPRLEKAGIPRYFKLN